jgi:hypothetical protein
LLSGKHFFLFSLALYGGASVASPLGASAFFSTATLPSYNMVGPELPLCPNKKNGATRIIKLSHYLSFDLFYRASRFNKKARAVARA